MAGLSSKASAAFAKAVSVEKKVPLSNLLRAIASDIDQEGVLNNGREREAERILRVEKYADGSEIWPKGDLVRNLLKGLDEAGLREALTVVKAAYVNVLAKEAEWIEKERRRHEETAPGVEFRPDFTQF